jgi:hypothetical protein
MTLVRGFFISESYLTQALQISYGIVLYILVTFLPMNKLESLNAHFLKLLIVVI